MSLVNIICGKYSSCRPSFSNLAGFLDDKYSDIMVSVSYADFETKCYKLHRNILAGCSLAFHQLLEHHQTLDITFMSPAEFELLILFLYTGDVYFDSVSELCSGLYAASLYQLDNLLSTCRARLQEKLDEDNGNAILLLQMDERFNCRADNVVLFDQVDKLIRKDYRQILSSPQIEELEKGTLKHLLQMKSISRVPEVEIFRALLRWTKTQCIKSGIEQVSENLQKLAEDLIFHIRYNLIPVEILGTEILKSGLVPKKLFAIILKRCYDDKIDVPFCTKYRDQEEVQFETNCTLEEHVVNQVCRWSTVDALSWNSERGYFPLSAAASSKTQWMVQFRFEFNDDFVVRVFCESLDVQFQAAAVRLFVVVEHLPQAWTEVAAVLKSGEGSSWWSCRFPKKLSEMLNMRPLNLCVRAQWTELEELPSTVNLWNDGAAHISCQWRLNGWRSVTPTSEFGWSLFSETFGQKGALWRIFVRNQGSGFVRQLMVGVVLQHLPTSVNWTKLSWNCALSLWSRQLDQQNKDMEQSSCCSWIAIDDVSIERRNPLDLNVEIHVSREN